MKAIPKSRQKTTSTQSNENKLQRQVKPLQLYSEELQPKLKVGQPGDKYEQEANANEERIMRMGEEETLRPKRLGEEEVQRTCSSCGESAFMQKSSGTTPEITPEITPEFTETLNRTKGGGEPLPEATSEAMGNKFNSDFSNVRVHTGSEATGMNEQIRAKAFTHGSDIYFKQGNYDEGSSKGKRLLAHELTHVVQQDSSSGSFGLIQEKPNVTQHLGMLVVKRADGSIEVTANRPWRKESSIGSTVIDMADATPGITVDDLIKELVDCGAYKNEKHVREGFIQGTRIVVKEGRVLEVSVRGKVYKAGGVQKPDFNFFLNEGTSIFSKAGFGLSSGIAQGRDAGDGYDSRYWKEIGARGTIQALVPAWDAMDKMVENIDQDVPKAGGGKTKWRFDCFEATQILRLYAIWRTTTRSKFNRIYKPLKLGFHASTKTGLGEAVHSDGPGKPAYKYVGGTQSGSLLTGAREVTLSKSIEDIAIDAPNGSLVSFGNKDIHTRCAANPRLSMCDFSIENTIKVGSDQYFAHPFGVVSSGTIFEKMAKAAAASPSLEYYRKNIYVSTVRYPK